MKPLRRAVLQLEAIAALITIIVVIGAFTAGMLGLARSSHDLIARQQATLAAEAVLNDIRNGATAAPESLKKSFQHLEIQIERTPASGDFAGFDRATVQVDAFTHGRKSASVRLSGLVQQEAVR